MSLSEHFLISKFRFQSHDSSLFSFGREFEASRVTPSMDDISSSDESGDDEKFVFKF